MRAHAWRGRRCARCGLPSGSPASCPVSDGQLALRSHVARIERERLAALRDEFVTNISIDEVDIVDPYPLPDEQLIAAERAEWVDRYFGLSTQTEEDTRRIYARWNVGPGKFRQKSRVGMVAK